MEVHRSKPENTYTGDKCSVIKKIIKQPSIIGIPSSLSPEDILFVDDDPKEVMAVKDKWKDGLATRQVVPREGLKNTHMRAISEMVASE